MNTLFVWNIWNSQRIRLFQKRDQPFFRSICVYFAEVTNLPLIGCQC